MYSIKLVNVLSQQNIMGVKEIFHSFEIVGYNIAIYIQLQPLALTHSFVLRVLNVIYNSQLNY